MSPGVRIAPSFENHWSRNCLGALCVYAAGALVPKNRRLRSCFGQLSQEENRLLCKRKPEASLFFTTSGVPVTLPCTGGFDWAAAALSLSPVLRLILRGGVRCRGSLVMIYLDSYFVQLSCWSRFCPSVLILNGRELDHPNYTCGFYPSCVDSSFFVVRSFLRFIRDLPQRPGARLFGRKITVSDVIITRVGQSVRVHLNIYSVIAIHVAGLQGP